MKTILKNPINLIIMLIMVLTIALILSCSSNGSSDSSPSDEGSSSSNGSSNSSPSDEGSSSSIGGGNSSSSSEGSSSSVGGGDSSSSGEGSLCLPVMSPDTNACGNSDEGSSSSVDGSSSVASSSSVKGCPNAVTDSNNNTMTCGGQTYTTVEIGTQTWMAENLNYRVFGCYNDLPYVDGTACISYCYNNDPANCDKYGSLYDHATAMVACPSGWYLPSNFDWDQLFRFADGTSGTESPYNSPTAGKHLKATEGWDESGNGQDTHGFAALPGGGSFGDFSGVGKYGNWWSSDMREGPNDVVAFYYRGMTTFSEGAFFNSSGGESSWFSVRCVAATNLP